MDNETNVYMFQCLYSFSIIFVSLKSGTGFIKIS